MIAIPNQPHNHHQHHHQSNELAAIEQQSFIGSSPSSVSWLGRATGSCSSLVDINDIVGGCSSATSAYIFLSSGTEGVEVSTTNDTKNKGGIINKNNQNKNKNKRVRRNVSISQTIEIFEIPNLDDLVPYNKDLYLSRDELSKIHSTAWETVDMLNLGMNLTDQNDFSKRGLEDLKETTIQRRKKMRQNAYKIVFGVQTFANGKKTIECMDPIDVMADLYCKAAAPAKKEAYMTGISDAIAAGRALDL